MLVHEDWQEKLWLLEATGRLFTPIEAAPIVNHGLFEYQRHAATDRGALRGQPAHHQPAEGSKKVNTFQGGGAKKGTCHRIVAR